MYTFLHLYYTKKDIPVLNDSSLILELLIPLMPGCSQNLKQVPQNFIKVFNVDDVTLSS